MDVGELQRNFIDYKLSLYTEGFLNEDFHELHKQFQNGRDSESIFEYVQLFFDDFENDFNKLEQALLEPHIDFEKAYSHAFKLKGHSFCIGAERVNDVCITLCNICKEEQPDVESCLRRLSTIDEEYALVKDKLERLLGLEKQILEAGGSVPNE